MYSFVLMLAVAVGVVSAISIGTTPAIAKADPTVIVTGRVDGFLPAPCNCNADVNMTVVARGDSSALIASGVGHASTGVTNSFELNGSVVDSNITLNGTIVRSTSSFLVGSPVRIEANADTEEITYTMWPVGGPFKGLTLVFTGAGKVIVTDN